LYYAAQVAGSRRLFEKELDRMIRTEKCRAWPRGCRTFIFFAVQNANPKNPEPRPNPLEAKPSENGNLRLDPQTMTYDVLTGDALKAARDAKETLYVSHFATCEFRSGFRKGGAKKAGSR
jgi:hypothetical protein